MYTTVRIVKMYACSTTTSSSKRMTTTFSATRNGSSGASGMLFVQHAAHSSATAVSRMWPAIMLASSRTLSEKGRTMNFEMNSMGTTRTSITFGTPGGTIEPLKYCPMAPAPRSRRRS